MPSQKDKPQRVLHLLCIQINPKSIPHIFGMPLHTVISRRSQTLVTVSCRSKTATELTRSTTRKLLIQFRQKMQMTQQHLCIRQLLK